MDKMDNIEANSEEKIYHNLRRKYLIIFLLANFIDWLQGPYLYKLYLSYGYDKQDISFFYITGFTSSGISGIIVGYYADRFGRKKCCLFYFFSTIINCLTIIINNNFILHIGRIFGGISASILFSTFESWYISQHLSFYNLKKELIGGTLTDSTVYNGFLAILAGLIASLFVDYFNFGLKSSFIFIVPLAAISGGLCAIYWDENKSTNIYTNFLKGLDVILLRNNGLLINLGIIQILFETVMYIFVFLWTPIVEPIKLNNGVLFGGFMFCIVLGSACHSLLIFCRVTYESSLLLSLILALISITISTIGIHIQMQTNTEIIGSYLCLISFFIYELSVGLYFPAIGYLRGIIVPDCHRASVANWFRLPSNILICLVLIYFRLGVPDCRLIFALGSIGLSIAVFYCIGFIKILRNVLQTKNLIICT